MLRFVFVEHFREALQAFLLFMIGLMLAWPVVRYRLRFVAWPARVIMRAVFRLMGASPGIARVAGVIFGYNGLAVFLYMASGWHPIFPKIFAFWTGLNIGVLMGTMRREGDMGRSLEPSPEQWKPPPRLSAVCGLVVLLLELPCFWFAIGMGIQMGHAVQAGDAGYLAALTERATAYATVILPLLLASAISEAIAIRGSAHPR